VQGSEGLELAGGLEVAAGREEGREGERERGRTRSDN